MEAAGFKTRCARTSSCSRRRSGSRLQLEVGTGQRRRVEVTGAAPVLQTEEASVGNVVDVAGTAAPAGQPAQLHAPDPADAGHKFGQPQPESRRRPVRHGLFSVNGGRPQDNNFTLDGFDSNMQMMNSPGISPPMDAIQEFKVATNTGSEFGRSMGANVSHGDEVRHARPAWHAYEFLRNDMFDANEFFANRSGLGKTPFRLNQYGVAVGGPVLLPKLTSRQDVLVRLRWEGFRRRRGTHPSSAVCRPAAFRSGDFSALAAPGATPTISSRSVQRQSTPLRRTTSSRQARINPAIPTALELTFRCRTGPGCSEPGLQPQPGERPRLLHCALGLQPERETTVLLPLQPSER